MRKWFALIAAMLFVIPLVRADIATNLVSPFAFAQAFISIVIGIVEGLLVWFLVRKESLWRWLWITALILANIASSALGVLFSFGMDVLLQGTAFLPYLYRDGMHNVGMFLAYIIVAFVLTIVIEWFVLRFFQKKHRVENKLLLKALVIANAVSYTAIVTLFFITV